MSQIEKFLERIMRVKMPNDITFEEMSRFLKSIHCTMRKKGSTRHRQFKYPGYYEIITLMDGENVKEYQVRQVKDLLRFLGIVEED